MPGEREWYIQFQTPREQSRSDSETEQEATFIADDEKVICQTPTPGKQPTRIDRWKYDLIRAAILEAIPPGEQGVEFRALPGLLVKQLDPSDLSRLGSLSWYTTTVKLDMEVSGEIERVPGSKPQRLRLPEKIFLFTTLI